MTVNSLTCRNASSIFFAFVNIISGFTREFIVHVPACFAIDPDDKVIERNITKALYMADGSAKKQYDNLKETGYYASIMSGNISQQITVDSVNVDTRSEPYYFRCFGTMKIIRPNSIVTRSLITQGYLRNVSRSDHNPHGFLIERWETLENKDLKTENR